MDVAPIGDDNLATIADPTVPWIWSVETIPDSASRNRLERHSSRVIPVSVGVLERNGIRLSTRISGFVLAGAVDRKKGHPERRGLQAAVVHNGRIDGGWPAALLVMHSIAMLGADLPSPWPRHARAERREEWLCTVAPSTIATIIRSPMPKPRSIGTSKNEIVTFGRIRRELAEKYGAKNAWQPLSRIRATAKTRATDERLAECVFRVRDRSDGWLLLKVALRARAVD